MLRPTVPTFAGQEAAVTPPGQRELTCALDRLAALLGAGDGDPAGVDEVAELSRRVREDVLRVVVAGKSTLINALLARAVLPTGVVPLTAVPTTLSYGESEAVEVRYTDGRDAVLGLDALPELVTEAGNPANRGGVAAVTVRLPAPLLAGGMELVDTPGTGSVYVHNTTAAAGALERMDAAVFVLTVDPPISETSGCSCAGSAMSRWRCSAC